MTALIAGGKLTAFVATRDRERAKSFYRDILGLALVGEDPFAMVFDSSGTMIRIATVRELVPAEYTVLGWEVLDIKTAVAELKSKGVAFQIYPGMGQDGDGVWTAPGDTRVAWFKDPDGNVLSVAQR